MDRELLQAELNDFYTATLLDAKALFDDNHLQKLSAPLLISISDAYLSAPIRIMFVGKETNGWWGSLGAYYAAENALSLVLKRYQQQMGESTWPGRFFPMLSRTARELTGARADAVAWTNLMRTDWEQGKGFSRNSKKFSDELTLMSQKMLRFEVSLLEPDVVIFACGASYDSVIKATFPHRTNSEPIVKRALWKFNIGKILCFRAQHPQAMRRKSSALKPVGDYYAEIFAQVKANFPQVYRNL
ncbi:MAG: hypothetical protein PSV40_15755 [Polaromonas sp.]|uniref:hypothetical protein n=1 Tax=Polaromonas sp. TaxID=1869339 RepID=UPI0024883BB4|nr:hypothetical protein [Polaromonas sp.]MDI1270543.1 hypothetical protein [Polaromonas sp.]